MYCIEGMYMMSQGVAIVYILNIFHVFSRNRAVTNIQSYTRNTPSMYVV